MACVRPESLLLYATSMLPHVQAWSPVLAWSAPNIQAVATAFPRGKHGKQPVVRRKQNCFTS
jgi:hypothetical protein